MNIKTTNHFTFSRRAKIKCGNAKYQQEYRVKVYKLLVKIKINTTTNITKKL